MTEPVPTDYERLRRAVEDALIVLDGYSGRVVDAAKVILREALTDGPLLCENCGKPMAEHDDMAHCWVRALPGDHSDGPGGEL